MKFKIKKEFPLFIDEDRYYVYLYKAAHNLDYLGSFDTLEDAEAFIEKLRTLEVEYDA